MDDILKELSFLLGAEFLAFVAQKTHLFGFISCDAPQPISV